MAQARVAFELAASQWGAAPDVVDAAFADVVARYQQPHRHYHTLEHLLEVLDRVSGTEVELAAWYHDVIYDPRASDSEDRSAVHAGQALELLRAPVEVIDEVQRLIRLTAGHHVQDGDDNGRMLVNADLAILTMDRARYERYARDVRAEYAHLDDATWRVGRRAVLERLRSVVADDSNIVWELATLSAS
jgi:predicted metal-dependent HD superfamily phosphohydrolase